MSDVLPVLFLTSDRSQPRPLSASCSSAITEGTDFSSATCPATKQLKSGCGSTEIGTYSQIILKLFFFFLTTLWHILKNMGMNENY